MLKSKTAWALGLALGCMTNCIGQTTAQSRVAKADATSRVEVVSNPDAVPLELAVIKSDEANGLKGVKGLADFEPEAISRLEEAQKKLGGAQVGFLVIWPMKSGDLLHGAQLKVAGAAPSGGLLAWGKNANVLEMRDAMGNLVKTFLNHNAPVLDWHPIPREATDAVLELPGHKPITLRFKLQ